MVDFQSPDKLILDKAALAFKDSSRVRLALNYFHERPKEFENSVQDFDIVVERMNSIVKGGELDKENYLHLGMLIGDEKRKIPTLLSISEILQPGKDVNKVLLGKVEETFKEAASWEWPKSLSDNNQLASGLLIEGFGLWLEKEWGKENTRRNFVLGFEETAILTFPNFKIVKDIFPWMVEEVNEFSPQAQKAIHSFKRVQRTPLH